MRAFAFPFDRKNASQWRRNGSRQGYDEGSYYNSVYIFSYEKTILYVKGCNASSCICQYYGAPSTGNDILCR